MWREYTPVTWQLTQHVGQGEARTDVAVQQNYVWLQNRKKKQLPALEDEEFLIHPT
jgi:hypothetical protein